MGLAEAVLVRAEQRGAPGNLPWGDPGIIPTNGSLGVQSAGVRVDDDNALAITTLGAAMSMISDSASSLPLLAMKNTKDRSKKLIDPAPPLIQNPWPEGTLQDWVTMVVNSLLLRGNAFGKIVDRDPDGYPTMCMPVHPDAVMARRDRLTGRAIYRFGGITVPTQDVMHLRGPLLQPGALSAPNPVEVQAPTWSNAIAATRYSNSFFGNSANPSGILSTDEDLSDEETLEWARAWEAAHGGIGGANRPAILTGGAKWQTITMSAEAAQFLQTRMFLREEVLSWVHVTPAKAGIVIARGIPMEDIQTQYMRDAVMPYTSRIENWFSRPEITRPSQRARFDFSATMRPSQLQLMQRAQIAANTGLEMTDELRADFDLEPLPNNMGRIIQRPMNMIAYDVDTGLPVEGQANDPSLKPDNPSGVGEGGGDPNQSPGITSPDTPSTP